MYLKRLIISAFIVVIILNCSNDINYVPILTQDDMRTIKPLLEDDYKGWEHKDIIDDSIPGISLNKAYKTILKNKKNKSIIVAVIDQVVDIDHKDLIQNIWTNTDEIANNNIDDDNNGYIDDIHGWDFLGNIEGIDNKYTHFDYTRMVKVYDEIFRGKSLSDVKLKDSLNFIKYRIAKHKLKQRIKSIPQEIEYANNVSKWKNNAKQVILKYFNRDSSINFTIKELDSIKVLYPKDSILQDNAQILSGFIANGFTEGYIESLKSKAENSINKQLNIEYDERSFLGDNPNDINDIKYGCGNVNNNLEIYPHGTIVSGVINKNTSIIKIMPLPVIGHGASHDKDIALAIRYAVNNGAKVINMSFSKTFSLYKTWVDDALKYAEKNNVLIITSAGNDYDNIDSQNKYSHPHDIDVYGKEFVDNFITVGSSSYLANENLKYAYSNYGKNNVDIFAPGEKIYTIKPNNKYFFDNGTSLSAAITSKVAALIFSYYPNLTPSQVKQIIMDSGVEYTFPVKTPTRKDKNKMTSFNELSKSGKIVNAYNALIMADSISKVSKSI